MQTETGRPDFLHHFMKKTDDGMGMSRDEIASTATLLIFAGSDTSATTCTSTTWFLVKNPEALRKLQEEVRGTFRSFEDITISSAAKLAYMHAVIQEALRLHPPGPISVPRLVDRPGVIVSGHLIPEGVSFPRRFLSLLLPKADSGPDSSRHSAENSISVASQLCRSKGQKQITYWVQ